MSSARARSSRLLASLLSTATRGLHVWIQYDRSTGRYGVHWTGGPSPAEMYDLAVKNAGRVPLLDVDDLVWLRTEPSARTPWGR